MEFRKELMGSAGAALIMAVLKEWPCHGYEIVQRANALSDGAFEWREGTLYPILHRLEQRGLIKGQWEATDGGRQRRVYRLTRAGAQFLEQQGAEWKAFSGAVNRVLEACHVC
jgi:PadR family transcriptional regulator, regulatory protein PadR